MAPGIMSHDDIDSAESGQRAIKGAPLAGIFCVACVDLRFVSFTLRGRHFGEEAFLADFVYRNR